ncbi:MAG: hypothetical protein ACR2JD_06545 [Nocardioides sp.]
MFVTDCQACGLRELRGPRSIELLVPTPGQPVGVDLVYRCTRCATVNAVQPQYGGGPTVPSVPVAA